jgi:hypothetical protein
MTAGLYILIFSIFWAFLYLPAVFNLDFFVETSNAIFLCMASL